MKARHEGIVIFFLLVIRFVTGIETALRHPYDLLKSKPDSNKQPLIVILNAQKILKTNNNLGDQFYSSGDGNSDKFEYEEEAAQEAKYLLYNYLNSPPNNDGFSLIDPKPGLRQALRQRCEAVIKCTAKCETKRDVYCPLNCKAVFDKLNLCETPKPKRSPYKKKQNECDTWGKTMPPKWLK